MPLIKGRSDAARSENIATEIRAGKSPAQSAAIAYSVQRKAGGKDEQFKGALDAVRKIGECLSPTAPPKPKESQ